MPAALSVLVPLLAELDRVTEALELLAAHGLDRPAGDLGSEYPVTMALHARGEARLAAGDVGGALADLRAVEARLAAIGERNPALLPWRSAGARALAARGDRAAARALAAGEVALARRFGAPRAVSIALRALAIAGDAAAAPALLGEAVALTEPSPARLEHAHALAGLGEALLAGGERDAACPVLDRACDLAHGCGAAVLEQRALAALRAAGRRPRRAARTGSAALTDAERRVALLAAQGCSNRQIAAELVVAARTVEFHLTAAYRKLGIRSRRELADALAGEPADAAVATG